MLHALPRLARFSPEYLVLSIAGCLLSLFVVAPAQAQEDNNPPPGFTALFNGKDLTGWWGLGTFDPRKLDAMSEAEFAAMKAKSLEDIARHWSVKDGILINDGHGLYLTTDKTFGDVELLIDYKTVPKADSGIYLRTTPQVQIWDSTETAKFSIGADKGSGGLWNNLPNHPGKDPLAKADKPFGEWNRFRIIQVGARTTIYLNDQLVVDHAIMDNYWDKSAPLRKNGYIQLQTHGGEISWRNIFVREIGSEEANKILASKSESGFESIFDGQSLAGWAGAADQYEVVNGAIRCQKGKGGNLYTEKEYANFVARLEFRLPPGGNNGLAIRYPGKGNPAYSGMTELQVLDNDAPQYAKLDVRQYHGSAYGMAAAKRGYLRPTGEWNFQEVTINGSRIIVELNGTVILDTDLSKVTEYMADSPHPGKDLVKGHFGFAGHGDAVEFRNLSIKPLAD
ncbi:3-keto-disaccharide hydrolase [Planctopirus hydrillae]|uniref:3-keto-alpha-glucoside-1,2-lyase/3-keto-2-hydroxy-glucal hydratase domain-containing protein n=1 Tax=Planctopirus hydrillae TaxID=1841610 RepID=A0A1C3EN42_9PLAN|nr:DUF1080 domain-containing protein [Planctopirus hydrillae]ODA34673.1 hypothetical protein A6X21_03075 [Planctopirus hydrillae]